MKRANTYIIKQPITAKLLLSWYKHLLKGQPLNYGMLKRMKRGVTLGLVMTFDCNLNCKHCIQKEGRSHRPIVKDNLTIEQWLVFIDRFPLPVREVWVSGGESALIKDVAYFINTLLIRKINVTVYTNGIDIQPFFNIKPSTRLRFYMTYHKKIEDNINIMRAAGFRVDVTGFSDSEIIDLSKQHRTDTMGATYIKPGVIRVGPDGLMFTNCADMVEYYHTINEKEGLC